MADPPTSLIATHERLLFLAPHPDDETLSAGGLMQRVLSGGGAVRVIFATDGDNNPWMQRLREFRFNLGPADRARYADARRREALAALSRLGVSASSAAFWNRPDQGLTGMLMSDAEPLIRALAEEIVSFRLTLLVVPSSFDIHADHSALAVIARLALERTPRELQPRRVLRYICHGRRARMAELRTTDFRLADYEQEAKREALACHATQLAFRKNWFLSHARGEETFVIDEEPLLECRHHPVRRVKSGSETIWLDLVLRSRPGAFGAATLCILLGRGEGEPATYYVDLDWSRGGATIHNGATDEPVCEARLFGGARGGFVLIPAEFLRDAESVFVKIDRRHGFFDEAGWRELPPFRGATEEAPVVASGAKNRAPRTTVVMPCYNVAGLCGGVLKSVLPYADHIIAIDDGSTDGTSDILRGIASESQGRVSLLTLSTNQGKGHALMAGFRHALSGEPFDALVTIDGDGQHRAEDIPVLAAACRDGAEFVIGERLDLNAMPLRSRFGNVLTHRLLHLFYSRCPVDTQSGFRAMDRGFVQMILTSLEGRRYETELQILLLALDRRVRIDAVMIPSIYLDHNRSSHFRPIRDSMRIYRALLQWVLRPKRATNS